MPSLVFEVDHIDNPWKANINYVGVYSQIRHLLDSGFRYWFDSEEIAKLNTRNRAYETPNLARELIATRYRKPGENEKAVYLTASDIGNVLPDGEEPPQKTCHFKSKGVTGVTLVTDNIYILCV